MNHASDPALVIERVITKIQELEAEIEFSANGWQETLMDMLRSLKQLRNK